eukprot:scaffold179210_cov44-Attheya_sp.AAC.1
MDSQSIQTTVNGRPRNGLAWVLVNTHSVNFYRHMWPKRAHILAPLTALQGKKNVQYGLKSIPRHLMP